MRTAPLAALTAACALAAISLSACADSSPRVPAGGATGASTSDLDPGFSGQPTGTAIPAGTTSAGNQGSCEGFASAQAPGAHGSATPRAAVDAFVASRDGKSWGTATTDWTVTVDSDTATASYAGETLTVSRLSDGSWLVTSGQRCDNSPDNVGSFGSVKPAPPSMPDVPGFGMTGGSGIEVPG